MAVKSKAPAITQTMVDELAEVRAQLRSYTAREKHLKEQFKAAGAGTYGGIHYTVEISFTTRPQLEMDAVRIALGEKFIEDNSYEVSVMNIKAVEVVQ
jgi:hypothetical protein